MDKKLEKTAANFNSENSIVTNKLIVGILLLKSVLFACILFLSYFGLTTIAAHTRMYLILQNMVIIPLTVLIACRKSFKGTVLSTILMLEVICNVALSYYSFSSYATIQLIIPLIISTRALNNRRTTAVSVITWLAFMAIVIIQIYTDMVSPEIHQYHVFMEETNWAYPELVLIYYVIPTTTLFIAVYLVCLSIIKNGKAMIIDESIKTARISQVETELQMASKIQEDALPPQHFVSPEGEVEISAAEMPSKEVSGDFYDYFMVDKRHIAFLVADVSDKGIPAALFMMSSKQAVKTAVLDYKNVDRALIKANRKIIQCNNSSMFLTLWIGIIDTRNGNVKYVNAGHPYPILKTADGSVSFLKARSQKIMGITDCRYRIKEVKLEAGDSIVLYSDGLTDALNPGDIPFGKDSLLALVEKTGPDCPEILKGISEYSQGVELFDDSTALSITYKGKAD